MEIDKHKNQPEVIEYINDFPTKEQEDQIELAKKRVEGEFQSAQKKIVFKKKVFSILGFALVLLMVIGAGLTTYFRSKNSSDATAGKQLVAIDISQKQDHVFVSDGKISAGGDKNVDSTQESSTDDKKGLAGTSENYRIRDIAIGGGSIVLAAETEILPLKINEVHSENLMSKDGKKMQILLSWKTNKPTKSLVKYSKNGNGSERNIKEDGYGFSHALVLNSLEPDTRYLFTVSAIDRGGNVANSDTLAAFTGSRPMSVFDLISAQMNNIFGWALK